MATARFVAHGRGPRSWAGRPGVMAFVADWLTVLVVAGLAMVSPGPNYAVTLKHGLLGSRRAGLWSAAGVAAGNLLHAVLSLLGLAVIVSRSILLFGALKWFGAAYLIYLGVRALLAKGHAAQESASEPLEAGRVGDAKAFRSSFLVSALNPKVTLFSTWCSSRRSSSRGRRSSRAWSTV